MLSHIALGATYTLQVRKCIQLQLHNNHVLLRQNVTALQIHHDFNIDAVLLECAGQEFFEWY